MEGEKNLSARGGIQGQENKEARRQITISKAKNSTDSSFLRKLKAQSVFQLEQSPLSRFKKDHSSRSKLSKQRATPLQKSTHQSIPNLRITMDSPSCPSIPPIPKLYVSLVGMQLVLRSGQQWKVEFLRFLFILGFRACRGSIGSVWSLTGT